MQRAAQRNCLERQEQEASAQRLASRIIGKCRGGRRTEGGGGRREEEDGGRRMEGTSFQKEPQKNRAKNEEKNI